MLNSYLKISKLLSILINKLIVNIKLNRALHADDTVIFLLAGKNVEEIHLIVNEELQELARWFNQNVNNKILLLT